MPYNKNIEDYKCCTEKIKNSYYQKNKDEILLVRGEDIMPTKTLFKIIDR